MDFATTTKLWIYQRVADSGRVPTTTEISAGLDRPAEEVRAACDSLAEKRLLVLATETREIVMAPPFSAVATPFVAEVGGRRYFANCAWDALGIPAALHGAGTVRTSCADCGDPMTIEVAQDGPSPTDCLTHFAVPAALWWEDIVYT
jgi:hypothetical protein